MPKDQFDELSDEDLRSTANNWGLKSGSRTRDELLADLRQYYEAKNKTLTDDEIRAKYEVRF